jgi:hypothetical protein
VELRQEISDLFGYVDESDFEHNVKEGRITFTVESATVTFQGLSALAALLGTSQISLRPEVRHGGSCPTCDFTYGVTVVEVAGAYAVN